MERENLPSIPRYFKEHVDASIDLTLVHNIPCPFHNEVSGKSFSYKQSEEIWRCFGACKCGGDVIDLHRLHYKIKSRDEAKKSLYALYGIKWEVVPNFNKERPKPNPEVVSRNRAYALALKLAKTVDDWLELDYIMSKTPLNITELETFCFDRGLDISKGGNANAY